MLFRMYKRLPLVIRSCCKILQRIFACGFPSLKIFWDLLNNYSRLFVDEFYRQTESHKNNVRFLKQMTGLHALLPNPYSYSVVTKVDQSFTAPQLEIVNNYENAKGDYILFLKSAVRCDLLYRYEQILRLKQNKKLVLFASKKALYMPFIFSDHPLNALLVPKHFGKTEILDLDLAGAEFLNIPFLTNNEIYRFDKNSLEEYSRKKGLDWKYSEGYLPRTYRATPPLNEIPKIHVIIPFKNQKELTLKAIHSLLNQKGVDITITAIDNDSDDTSISLELERLGVGLLIVQEPFNFSRLNNLAVKNSQEDLILFMNNDVELDENALIEMARWALQPQIGLVGCRLHYPNGMLQHGGLLLDEDYPSHKRAWIHIDKGMEFSRLNQSLVQGVVDGVTAACALMKKNLFLEINGFDETYYPIAYSDTHLAEKLKAKGYLCFYTPYAEGIHHESISRSGGVLEEIESSTWFHNLVISS